MKDLVPYRELIRQARRGELPAGSYVLSPGLTCTDLNRQVWASAGLLRTYGENPHSLCLKHLRTLHLGRLEQIKALLEKEP